MLKKGSLLFLIGLITTVVSAQFQHPPTIKWVQIKTPHFKVIAPEGIKSNAIETAKLMEHVYKPVSSTLHYPKKPLKLLLYNQTVISNGFVTLAPTYSGFYTTPLHDANAIGGSDWFQQLAVHEYRHYVQFEKLNDHFTQFMKGLFGEGGNTGLGGQFGFTVWSTPMWMFEGDAICSETTLSEGGRGRLPAFNKHIRTNELEGIRYNYDKAYLGSYKDYVPNHYYLGYNLCSGIKANYGLASWDKIMTRSSKFSIWPYSFTRSTKRITGVKFKHQYNNILNEYASIWTDKAKNKSITKYHSHVVPKKVYTNYEYPFAVADKSFICVKAGMADASTLCLVRDGQETELGQISPIDRIHSNGRQVVWSVVTHDLRWGERSFADVVLYDINTRTKKKITRKQKFFAPAISPDGKHIAVVEYTEQMLCSLVILNADNGDVIARYPAPDNSFIRMPSWSGNGKQITFTETRGQEIRLSVLNTENGNIEPVLPWSNEVITAPVFYGDYILYNSPHKGIDAVYAINLKTNNQYLVASGKYGVYNASVSNKQLAFQEYTSSGFNIASATIDTTAWQPKNQLTNVFDNYYQKLIDQEAIGNIFADSIADNSSSYKVKKYRPLLKAINIHSWAPSIVPNGFGYGIHSNDILNTTQLHAGFNYFPQDDAFREFASIKFSKFYPVLSINASNGNNYRDKVYADNQDEFIRYNEKVLGLDATLPINLSGEINYSRLDISAGYNYVHQRFDSLPNSNDNIMGFNAWKVAVNYTNLLQSSIRDLYPRYGVTARGALWFWPSSENFVALEGNAYLPGLAKHHSLNLKGGYQYTTPYYFRGIYILPDEIEFARGYEKIYADKKLNGIIAYTLPLLYPDLKIGPMLYLKRIHTSVFYNYGLGKYRNARKEFNSLGVDLNFEVNFFRFIAPIEVGVRYSYQPYEETSAIELLLFRTVF